MAASRNRKGYACSDSALPPELGSDYQRTSVGQLDLSGAPGATGRAATQWRDRKFELVAGTDRLARPSLADQSSRAQAFKAPGRDAAVRVLDLEDDEGVGTSELELFHHPNELNRIVRIEHRIGVVRRHSAAESQKDRKSTRLNSSHTVISYAV